MIVDKKAVGERIKSIRKSLGMSQEEFGRIMTPIANKGVVSNWELGKNLPQLKRITDIAFYGQITTDEPLYGKQQNQLIEWIESKIGDIKLVGLWDSDAPALYNKGYADAMTDILDHIKQEEKNNE